MASQVTTINVGGTLFTTTISTLTKDPESMLATMFSTDLPPARDSHGNVFIDRDPKTFGVILDFLRCGHLYDEGSDRTMEQLEMEADYFGLEGLLNIIKQRKLPKPRYDPDDGTRKLILVMTTAGSVSGMSVLS